jgi:hypothetical protein
MKTIVALVGTKFRGQGMVDLLARLPNGEPLILRREPSNPYDRNAVQVWAQGHHLGYLKGSQNKPLAMAMDNAAKTIPDYSIPANLSVKEGKSQPMVEFEL